MRFGTEFGTISEHPPFEGRILNSKFDSEQEHPLKKLIVPKGVLRTPFRNRCSEQGVPIVPNCAGGVSW